MASFDIIIVGGGTAGCVLASRLSSFSHLDILLIEAGPDNNADPKVSTPLISRRMFNDPKYDWNFQTIPQVGLSGRVIQQTRGRMIGGSSAINSHSLVYPNRAMHEAWAEIAGDERWSWERMERFYKKFQTVQSQEVTGKGSSTVELVTCGPIRASYPRHMNILQSAWEDVFRSIGAYSDQDGVSGRAMGGLTTTNAIDARAMKGERSHSGNSFLQPALGRVNLTVETDAIVERVVFQEHGSGDTKSLQAIGVTYEKGGITLSVRANKEVILCAGAFGSPQILELSGIGSKGILENAGVQCLVDLPGVGENLQDHLNYGPSIEVNPDIETIEVAARDPAVREVQREEYEEYRTGPLSEGAAYSFAYWPLQLFDTTADEADLQRLLDEYRAADDPKSQLHHEFVRRMILDPQEASATVFMTRKQRYTAAGSEAPGNYMTVVAMLSHPFSRGSSHIRVANPHEAPIIDCNYLSHPLDAEILARHAVQLERLLEQPTYTPILNPSGNRLPAEFNYALRTPEEAKEAIKKYGATNYHPCGTCAMARAELGGVVDGELRVSGISNLRVCDASIFPIIPRGNILSTVYAVAESGAEMIGALYS
ncbi:hypothetical protein J7T55_007815 [Diaporthe amygdali]|uniref:uncharacterized protein n=1 Tax=Phomopsis amygdali TaxID=1214568 RepID=UPI0022FEA7F0|nr:uncharacterized protein J7T55_007815 [Diaporthe amygdali]KAJ0107624.1 hypothetical protein J7T55_007815 [Diaporthe amygdali]